MTALLDICVSDLSALTRFGIKGPKSADWLASQGIEVPKSANTWLKTKAGILVLRLGTNEFLLEDSAGSTTCYALDQLSQLGIDGAYYVARVDASFGLSGSASLDLLSELCTLDLRPIALAKDVVLMTQLAGISVTLLQQLEDDNVVYRFWCDGTYGEFMRDVLQEVAEELG